MSTKKGKYGNPAKNRPALRMGDIYRKAQPTGVVDPAQVTGSMTGDLSDSHLRNAVVLDLTDTLLLESLDVSIVETVRQNAWDGQIIYLQLNGRVNKSDRKVSVGVVTETDGVASLISELLAIADRCGPELLDDMTRRLTALHQGKHVDLHWLRAAIDAAIETQDPT